MAAAAFLSSPVQTPKAKLAAYRPAQHPIAFPQLYFSFQFPAPPRLLHRHDFNLYPRFISTASPNSHRGISNNVHEVGGGNAGDGGDGRGGNDIYRYNDDGDDGDGDGEDNDGDNDENTEEAMIVLRKAKRSLDSLPDDLAAAIQAGRIPGVVVDRFLELDKSALMQWLLRFSGFKERLLADDLFIAKVLMECGVGVFAKTAAEYERRKENFFNELEIVFADVVMAVIADFMLVYLPAPTVSLKPPLALSAGPMANFFYNCPDNAFQVALGGTSYSIFQRVGAIMRNGTKLFVVGTTASLASTIVTNVLINARNAVDVSSSSREVEEVPILSTSIAYGFYMAVSSNLRYQLLAGVIEQRILEPLLHQQKLLLSTICFAVRTGNTYLGSLLWVDYARLVGIQKGQEEQTMVD